MYSLSIAPSVPVVAERLAAPAYVAPVTYQAPVVAPQVYSTPVLTERVAPVVTERVAAPVYTPPYLEAPAYYGNYWNGWNGVVAYP